MLGCSDEYNPLKNNSEKIAEGFLSEHHSNLEHLIKLAEKGNFELVQWIDENGGKNLPVNVVSMKGTKKKVEISDGRLDEFISFAKSKGIKSIWLQYFDDVWFIMKAFSYEGSGNSREGYYSFGNPSKTRICHFGEENMGFAMLNESEKIGL
ncbi:hypothetical protein AT746_00435 [Lacimicrobium alkaliphilum]|uniref:Uncharacterized protein n=2 Tax=Lacimicrobium alkaliphilum TaxID=1526571 RepID=A0A0U2ZEP5_9ALTE|nr:hypothetical protein AT746_00435 [Lacimicrobium alkaliphilum]